MFPSIFGTRIAYTSIENSIKLLLLDEAVSFLNSVELLLSNTTSLEFSSSLLNCFMAVDVKEKQLMFLRVLSSI